MTAGDSDLAEDYRAALAQYLRAADEAGRSRAYDLGHRAVEERVGLIEFIGIHRDAVNALVVPKPKPHNVCAAIDFFTESMSTFDMAQRGYWEAQERAVIERDIAVSLQRSLLPKELPLAPGLEVAVRYLPAGQHAMIGGDWYDVVQLAEGKLALVVGDVMGHGVPQAAVMGQLRLGFRAYLAEGHSLPDVVRHTDTLLLALDGSHTATLALVVVDLTAVDGAAAATVEVLRAGHPPPLHVGADGRARFLEASHDRLLGLPDTVERVLGEPLPVAAGDMVLLYTDGLLDTRERAGERGTDALQAVAEGFDGGPDELCDAVIEALVGDKCSDDVCLLAARLSDPGVGTTAETADADT